MEIAIGDWLHFYMVGLTPRLRNLLWVLIWIVARDRFEEVRNRASTRFLAHALGQLIDAPARIFRVGSPCQIRL